jgi:hypothetical protein
MGYKNYNIAGGWIKQTQKGDNMISAKTNNKVKLFVELEDGQQMQIENFTVFFVNEKRSEKAPDVNFVFSIKE